MVLGLPGQTFTFGSLTWTIGVDDNTRTVEAVQSTPALIEPTPAPTDLISKSSFGSSVPATHRPPPRYQRRLVDNSDLIESIDQVTTSLVEALTLVESVRDRSITKDDNSSFDHQQTECPAQNRCLRPLDLDMVIMVTPEGRTVRYRPFPVTGLRLGDYEALMEESRSAYPYGLANAASTYMDCIPHLFVDPAERGHVNDLYFINLPEADHPAPIVNMVEIK